MLDALFGLYGSIDSCGGGSYSSHQRRARHVGNSKSDLLRLQRQDQMSSSHQDQDCEYFLRELGSCFVLTPVVD